jgi:four helix bundle protein
MRDFRGLKVWEKSHRLALAVYSVTKKFPREEVYGLTSQIRRACVSIAANIAEGCGRNGSNELARFLEIASGSASELEYHLLLSHDLNFLPSPEHDRLAAMTREVKQMLTSLIQRLRSSR